MYKDIFEKMPFAALLVKARILESIKQNDFKICN